MNADYTPAPEGNQVGILVGLYHLGPQEFVYKGEKKIRDEVRVTFELPNAKRKFGEDEEEKPYMISKTGTYSMGDLAFLRKAVEACIGVKLMEGEAQAFDPEEALGKACLVNVQHFEVEGRKMAKIESVSPLPQGMEAPKQTNPSVVFDVINYKQEEFDALPDWLQEKVTASKFKPKDGEKVEEKVINPEDIPF